MLGKTSQFKLFYVLLHSFLCKRKTIQVIHLLCINVKKVDRSQPDDKCKERNNSVFKQSLSPLKKPELLILFEKKKSTKYLYLKSIFYSVLLSFFSRLIIFFIKGFDSISGLLFYFLAIQVWIFAKFSSPRV